MRRSASAAIIAAVLLLSIASTSAFNITILLSRHPGFEVFNDLLSRTHLAGEINRRSTITVLAVANDRIGSITGKTEDIQRRILSDHVILDYYDLRKLDKIKEKRTILTTLFQASGVADDQQGFLAVVRRRDGSVMFGSAVRGAPLDARLEGPVAAYPYNISVLSISQPIIAPGIDGEWRSPPLRPPPPPPMAKAPAPVEKVSPPAPPPAESPVEEEPADAPASAPAPAPGPADAPSADAPAADADDNQEAAKKPNAAAKEVVTGVAFGLVVALASFLAA